MLTDDLYRLKKEDVPKAVETLKDAFKNDPLWIAVFGTGTENDAVRTAFFTIPVLYSLKYGKVFAASPGMEGVAAWVPGKYAEMTLLRLIICGALPIASRLRGEPMKHLSAIGKQLEPAKKKAMKNKPHVYLSIIGIGQREQGKGYGSKLLNAIKEECDRDGVTLYLETETQENVRFYEKHGFNVLQQLMLKKLGLPLWQMALAPPE